VDAKHGLRLLFASRLIESKGLRKLVHSVTNLRRTGLEVTLNVAGIIDEDNKDPIPFKQIERWHKNGLINWLGQINKDMPAVIADNDAVVLPTCYAEGLPRILIEANACKRPVITTDIPGCREFVTNGVNGLLIPGDDSKALENAVRSLADRHYCALLGGNGRKRVKNGYTNKHVVEIYGEIYKHRLLHRDPHCHYVMPQKIVWS
jgi:glycosyltransferase involved in cell wall biosynthesis